MAWHYTKSLEICQEYHKFVVENIILWYHSTLILCKNMEVEITVQARGAQNFQKSRSHPKILGARRVAGNKFRTEDPV